MFEFKYASAGYHDEKTATVMFFAGEPNPLVLILSHRLRIAFEKSLLFRTLRRAGLKTTEWNFLNTNDSWGKKNQKSLFHEIDSLKGNKI